MHRLVSFWNCEGTNSRLCRVARLTVRCTDLVHAHHSAKGSTTHLLSLHHLLRLFEIFCYLLQMISQVVVCLDVSKTGVPSLAGLPAPEMLVG